MSLVISTNSVGVSFVASVAPAVQLLSVAEVSTNLSGTFWDLAATSQRNTLHSACHYLDGVDGADGALLTSIRQDMLPEIGSKTEPSALERLKLSRLITTWSLHHGTVVSKFAEAPKTPLPVPPGTPPPPSSPASTRLGNPLFEAPRPPLVPRDAPETTDEASPPAPAAAVESADDHYLYPSLWWDFSKETRLGLKQLALGGDGKVREQTQNDESHAGFLHTALATWMNEVKDALLEARSKDKDKVGAMVSRQVTERFSMILEVMEYFRRETVRGQELGRAFWRMVSEKSELRLALSRLTMRDIQSTLDDEAKARVERIVGHLERGMIESVVLPHFEGALSSTSSDEAQGTAAAEELTKYLTTLPMSVRTDLNQAQLKALHECELILRAAAQKMRGNADSAYVSHFVRSLSADVMRLPAVIEMIMAQRSSASSQAADS